MVQDKFNQYMEEFKELPLKEKQKIAIEQLKMLVGLAQTMCDTKKVDSEMIMNRELVDINSDNYSQDDFVEAVIVYINSIQNLLCDYNLKS